MALMMEAVIASETSLNFYQTTQRNIPKDSHLHIRHCENLKSHPVFLMFSEGTARIGFDEC
jgi:hypothetical protein